METESELEKYSTIDTEKLEDWNVSKMMYIIFSKMMYIILPEFQPPSPSRLNCKIILNIFPIHFQSPIHFSHLCMIWPQIRSGIYFSKWSDIWNLRLALINLMYSWKQNKFLIFIEDRIFYKSNTMNFKVFFLISLCLIKNTSASLSCRPCEKTRCHVSFWK